MRATSLREIPEGRLRSEEQTLSSVGHYIDKGYL